MRGEKFLRVPFQKVPAHQNVDHADEQPWTPGGRALVNPWWCTVSASVNPGADTDSYIRKLQLRRKLVPEIEPHALSGELRSRFAVAKAEIL